jgi:phosphatidylglycerol:prolipoprotein diacylglycerol transferase
VDAAIAAGAGAWIGTHLFPALVTGAVLRVSPWTWLGGGLGTASWGAYFGALAGLLAYGRLIRPPAWAFLDIAASCAALGPVIARFACLLAGDDFGRPSALPWAITFPQGSPAFAAHVSAELIPPNALSALPVHPLQIYLAANGLMVFLAVSSIWRRWSDRPGITLGAYLTLYGGTRFWWEFLRDPAAGGASGLLSLSQVMCLGMLALGTLVLAWRLPAPIPRTAAAVAKGKQPLRLPRPGAGPPQTAPHPDRR